MIAQVGDTLLVVDLAGRRVRLAEGGAVLGHEERARMIGGVDLLQRILKALRIDFPAHLRIAGSRHRDDLLGVAPAPLRRASSRRQRRCAEDPPLVTVVTPRKSSGVAMRSIRRRGSAARLPQ